MEIGTLITGAIIGAIPSWFISRHYAKKSSAELIGSLKRQTSELSSSSSFNSFERMLRNFEWRQEFIDGDECWVCERDNTFQIHKGDDRRAFREKWTDVFPDQNGSMLDVHLKIQGVTIKSYPFISGDGGRYTLPLPDLVVVDDEPSYHWNIDSVEARIAEIMGNFYRYKTLAEVAALTKVNLNRGANHA